MTKTQEIIKDFKENEKKAVLAAEAFYQKKEGKEWHLSGVNEKEATSTGFKLSLMFCKGDACTMIDVIATLKDGKYECEEDAEDDGGFF